MNRIVLSLIATTFLTNLALADDGRFIFPGRAFPLAFTNTSMVVVDLDGDGFLDAATAVGGFGVVDAIAVTWGTADGRFVDSMAFGPSSSGGQIAAGDLGSPGDPEPDGLLDLVLGWWTQGQGYNISVFHGVAGRKFVETVLFQALAGAIATGDFDGDTYQDIAWIRAGRPPFVVSVAYNGPAGFSSPFSVPLGADPLGFASTDLNGDGRADLVVAGFESHRTLFMTALYGRPTQGQFDSRQYTMPTGLVPRFVSLGDFDGDQLFDAAIGGTDASEGYVFYGESLDSFVETAVPFTHGPCRDMAAGDLDGDGRSDLVCADWWDGRNSFVLYGRSSRTFSPSVTFAAGYSPRQVAAADMDGDGRAEVFAYISDGPSIAIHRSRPRGKIATRWEVDIPDSGPVSLAAADFNDDNAPDLAIADRNNESVKLFWGAGNGSFEIWGPDLPAGAPPQDIASAHLDDDELPDLALTTSSNNLLVWHSAGGGNFQEPPEQFDVGSPQSALTTGDFNNDGRTDIALLAGDQLVIFKGLRGGSLDPIPLTQALPDTSRGAIAAGHLDMDQYLDLVVCLVDNAENVLILYGRGDGTFSDGERFNIGNGLLRVTTGDINADGLGDAVIVKWSGHRIVTSLLQQPGGGFVRQDITLGGFSCAGIADISLADFDLDGVGDVAFAWCRRIVLLFGQQAGGLDYERFESMFGGPLVVEDFNRDGRPDIAVANDYGPGGSQSFLYVTLNQSNAKFRGDLTVTALDAPTSGISNDLVTIEWTVQNKLPTPLSGAWTDALYLSRDELWDINDIRLGTLPFNGNLAPNGDPDDHYDASLDVTLPGVFEGPWFLIVRTDATDAVLEVNGEHDNVMESPIAMTLPQIDVCPPKTPCPGINDAFSAQRRALYYKVETVVGEDLLLTLDATAAEGINELYIRYEEVPSRSLYDAKYQGGIAADQTARIPGTEAGTYYVLAYADALPPAGPAGFNLRAEYLPFAVSEFTPQAGGNTGRVTVTFVGSRFRPDTDIALLPSGGAEIHPIRTHFYDTSTFSVTFDLDGQLEAMCDIRLTNPGDPPLLLEAAFTIEEGQEWSVGGVLNSQSLITRQTVEYRFAVWNTTNIDVPYMLITLAAPESQVLDIYDYPDSEIDDLPGFDLSVHGRTFILNGYRYYTVLVRGFSAGTANMLPGQIWPNHTEHFRFRVTAQPGTVGIEFKIGVQPLTEEDWINTLSIEAELVRQWMLSDPPADPLVEAIQSHPDWEVLRAVLEQPLIWRDAYLDTAAQLGLLGSSGDFPGDPYAGRRLALNTVLLVSGVTAIALNPATLPWSLVPLVGGVYGYCHSLGTFCGYTHEEIDDVIFSACLGALPLLGGPLGCFFSPFGWQTVFPVSRDPNDKLSPGGDGNERYIRGGGSIPYTIRFENLSTATAAALKLDVTDPLTPNLDWTTLALEEIGFDGTVIEIPEGLSHYEGRVEIDGWTWNETDGWHRYDSEGIPVMPLVVDIEAGIDIVTGELHWSLICADPMTGVFPADPYAGFLPPNQESIFYPDPNDPNEPPRLIHPGEGYVKFSVHPVAGLPTGAEITNAATIVFDWNEPIDTPEVLNTIDAGAPSSEVAGLPAQTPSRSFEVPWTGQDDIGGSGLNSVTIYVSDNGGAYTAWTTAAAYGSNEPSWPRFEATEYGHTYRFYSIARDHVGNIEDPPIDPNGEIIPDAETTVLYDLDPGDLNCDSQINAVDIEPFILALFDPEEYEYRFPYCDINLGDINGDGSINALDIEPFLNLLFP